MAMKSMTPAPSGSTYIGVNVFGDATFGDAEDIIETNLNNIFTSVGPDPNTGVISGVLADNGGPVETIMFLAGGSGGVAHNAGENVALPLDLDGDSISDEILPIDARGEDRIFDTAVDVGAVELGPISLAIVKTWALFDDADGSGDVSADDTIRYTYDVANIDFSDLVGVTVVDDRLGPVTLSYDAGDGVERCTRYSKSTSPTTQSKTARSLAPIPPNGRPTRHRTPGL